MAFNFSMSFGDDDFDTIQEHYEENRDVDSTKELKDALKNDMKEHVMDKVDEK